MKVVNQKGKVFYKYRKSEMVKLLVLVNQIQDNELRLSLISKLGVE